MKNLLLTLLVASALVAIGVPCSAAPVTCPAVGRIAAGCNEIIMATSPITGSITTVNISPYDGSDDQLVGIVYTGTGTLASFTVNGPGITGFDGDGAFQTASGCVSSGTNTNGCLGTTEYGLSGTQPNPNDYEGSGPSYSNPSGLRPDGSPAVSFTCIGPAIGPPGCPANTVVLDFLNGGLAPGQFAYFSLEAAPTIPPSIMPGPGGVPEPGSITLLGAALFAAYGFVRRRRVH
jgi:PEP-CTERM motif